MHFLLYLSRCVKSYGHFCKFWLFAMPAHQIWSCHVTQDANFELFLFCPNSIFKVGDNSLIIHKSAYHLFSALISNFSANEENIR